MSIISEDDLEDPELKKAIERHASAMKYKIKGAPTILLEGVKSSLDGAVDSGEILRGEIVHDVPPSEYYEIHYSEVFKKGKGKWKFPEIDIKEKK